MGPTSKAREGKKGEGRGKGREGRWRKGGCPGFGLKYMVIVWFVSEKSTAVLQW